MGNTLKILVTGGGGFIGHNVVRLLEQQGHTCHVIDSQADYKFIPQDELTYLFDERQKRVNSKFHNASIVHTDLVNTMFEHVNPDVVIHLASFPRQKVVNENPALASEVMSAGLINLLEAAKTHNTKRFVYISSSMVYGDFTDDVKEDAVCNPQGQYGIMKLAGEWLVKDYARCGHFNYTIIRPSAVYGPYDVEDRVVSKFIITAMRNGILKVNGANESLDFTYVEDTAKGIVLAATSDNANNKTYNITRGQGHTLLDAATLITQIVGKGTVEVRDRDFNFPSRGSLNINAARNDLGYNPTVDIADGFERYFNWVWESKFWQQKL